MCKLTWISLDMNRRYCAGLEPHFFDPGMESVLGKHCNNETNQVLSISDAHQSISIKNNINLKN